MAAANISIPVADDPSPSHLASQKKKKKKEVQTAGGALEAEQQHVGIFSMYVCVPGCIDLYGAARQTCLPEWTEDKENQTEWPLILYSLATGCISRLRRCGNPASAEPGGRQHTPYRRRESSFAPWQWGR